MNKLKIFGKTLIKSLTEPKYYTDVLKAPFSFSFKYLLTLFFFILFIQGLIFSLSIIPLIPKIPHYVSEGKKIVKSFYPPELTVTVKDGNVRTNVDEPYAIPFPPQFKENNMNFAVIDTKASVEDAKKYNTLLFITKNAVVYPDTSSKGGYKVNFLSDFKGYLILNNEVYNRLVDKILPYFDYLPIFIYVMFVFALLFMPFFGSFFYLSGVLFYLLFLSILLFIVTKIMKKGLSYVQVFHLGMHGITFSLVFSTLKTIFNVQIPYPYTLPFILWMLLVFNSLKQTHETVVSHPQTT